MDTSYFTQEMHIPIYSSLYVPRIRPQLLLRSLFVCAREGLELCDLLFLRRAERHLDVLAGFSMLGTA